MTTGLPAMNWFIADERDHCPFHAHHAAHEGVDEDEQRKLPPVLAQTEPDAY